MDHDIWPIQTLFGSLGDESLQVALQKLGLNMFGRLESSMGIAMAFGEHFVIGGVCAQIKLNGPRMRRVVVTQI
jgi:hypothetical protein